MTYIETCIQQLEKLWREGCFSYNGDPQKDPMRQLFIDMRGEDVEASFNALADFLRTALINQQQLFRERLENMLDDGRPLGDLIKEAVLALTDKV